MLSGSSSIAGKGVRVAFDGGRPIRAAAHQPGHATLRRPEIANTIPMPGSRDDGHETVLSCPFDGATPNGGGGQAAGVYSDHGGDRKAIEAYDRQRPGTK